MTTSRQRVGRLGENLANAYLRRSGWLILDRNWRCRHGEIDIVGLDGAAVVICEVRTRQGRRAGTPLESVTPRKVRRLRQLAWLWVQDRGAQPSSLRVDVIGVQLDESGRRPAITHLRGVE